MPRESVFVRRLLLKLREHGVFTFKTHGSMYQMAGLPDVVGCCRGYFFAFECKLPGEQPTKLQSYIGKQIQAAGGIFAVVTTLEEAHAALVSVVGPIDLS